MDENGHGTHVAGTIAATSNNGIGVAGVADVSIMPLRFLGPDGSGDTAGALAAVNYVTNMLKKGVNVRVTNNSWGGGGFSQNMYNAIKANGDAGGLFIAAAGNGGTDGVGDNNDITANYPSNYNLDNVIAVAATDSKDARGSFSNYGKTTVDLAAPGVMIASTYLNGGYVYLDGTSMATPHVSGAAALAFSLRSGRHQRAGEERTDEWCGSRGVDVWEIGHRRTFERE
jgi:subtilisin family serine protease